MDDMSGTLKWSQGAGTVSLASDPTFVFQGANALKLLTGNVAGNQALAQMWLPNAYYDLQFLVFELYWDLSGGSALAPRDFTLTWDISDQLLNQTYTGGVRYWANQAGVSKKLIQRMDNTGAWVNAYPLPVTIDITVPMFNHWTVVLQRATSWTYRWMMQNDRVMGLNNLAMVSAPYTNSQIKVVAYAETDTASAVTAYVGGFLLSDNIADTLY